jgi:hypothetical protein
MSIDEPDPKSSDDIDENPRPSLDDRFDPDDPKAEDGGVTSRISRDPSSDIDDEELAEDDILEMSELDEGDKGEGPDA